MPTGYTSIIGDGATFKEFLLKCATAFYGGREGDVVLAKEPRSDMVEYYRDEVKVHEERLIKLQNTSDKDLIREEVARKKTELANHKKYIKEMLALKKKYEKMLKQVQKWVLPDPLHKEFKEFMIQQIQDSIRWDCSPEYCQNRIIFLTQEIKNVDVKKLRTGLTLEAERNIKYSKERLEEAEANFNTAKKWIDGIHKSMRKYEKGN